MSSSRIYQNHQKKFEVVFLGTDVGVGKKTLTTRFMYENFDTNNNEGPSGIDLHNLEESTVRLNYCDRPNVTDHSQCEERFWSSVKKYISKSSCAVFVYDITNVRSFSQTSECIESIKKETGCKVIMLVGNKADLSEQRKVSTEEGEKKAKEENVKFFEISAKSGYNVKDLFLCIENASTDSSQNIPLDTCGHSSNGNVCIEIFHDRHSEFSRRIQHRNELYGDLVKLWKSKEFSDIVLQCDGGELTAHKFILSARSEVFLAMFSRSGMTESTSKTVKIDDVKLDTMKILVKYMYTGCVSPLSIEEMSDLLRAADKYQLKKLKNECFQLLIAKLEIGNAVELVMLAHLHNPDDGIKLKIQEYVIRMREELGKVPEFKSMMEENPTVLTAIMFETYKQLD